MKLHYYGMTSIYHASFYFFEVVSNCRLLPMPHPCIRYGLILYIVTSYYAGEVFVIYRSLLQRQDLN